MLNVLESGTQVPLGPNVDGFEISQTRRHTQERLAHLRKKRELRLQIKRQVRDMK